VRASDQSVNRSRLALRADLFPAQRRVKVRNNGNPVQGVSIPEASSDSRPRSESTINKQTEGTWR